MFSNQNQNIKESVFLTQIISRRQKNADGKLYYRFHVGKNGTRVGSFQKIVILPNIKLKVAVNRLPPFNNLSDHTNRFLMV